MNIRNIIQLHTLKYNIWKICHKYARTMFTEKCRPYLFYIIMASALIHASEHVFRLFSMQYNGQWIYGRQVWKWNTFGVSKRIKTLYKQLMKVICGFPRGITGYMCNGRRVTSHYDICICHFARNFGEWCMKIYDVYCITSLTSIHTFNTTTIKTNFQTDKP